MILWLNGERPMGSDKTYYYVNIRDILDDGHVNEEDLRSRFSEFSCTRKVILILQQLI